MKYANILSLTGLLGSVLLSGCMVGPKYVKPSVPMATAFKEEPPQSFKESDGWKESSPSDQTLRGKWWEIFGDTQLNALEEELTTSNQDLKVAEARLRQSRAEIRLNHSAQFPSIGVSPSLQNVRLSENGPYFNRAFANNGTGDFTLPVDFSYEVDLWGKIRHSVHAAQEESQATAADLETARLSLHAELARDYFDLRIADLQGKLLLDTVVAYSRALQLIQSRFQEGATPRSDVAQAQTQLDAAKVQLTDIGLVRTQNEHAIAILIGKAPASFRVTPNIHSPLKIPTIPVGVPSALLERRPDIAAAERRAVEANEQIGIAKAAYFPSLVIGATGGFQGTSIVDWFNWPSRFWAAGPQISESILDGGRRRAGSEAAIAGYDGTVAIYRQTALAAFQEVEDNLAALRILETESQQQTHATASAEDSLQLFTKRYEGGVDNYLEVITAQTTALANELNDIGITRRRMEASVLLIKAVGGGWDISQLPRY